MGNQNKAEQKIVVENMLYGGLKTVVTQKIGFGNKIVSKKNYLKAAGLGAIKEGAETIIKNPQRK